MRLLRISLAVVLLAVISTIASYAQEVFPDLSVLPVFVYDTQRGVETLIGIGSGFVVEGKRRYLATTKHNMYPDGASNHTTFYTTIEGNRCQLEVVWAHKVADVGRMRFRCDAKLVSRLVPFSSATEVPTVEAQTTLYGFQLPHRIFGNKKCREFEVGSLCERVAPLHISHVDAPTKDFAPVTAKREAETLAGAKKKRPKTTHGDLFFSAYLVASRPSVSWNERFVGTSGGALVDQRGRVVGIMMGETDRHLVFIPIRELTKEPF